MKVRRVQWLRIVSLVMIVVLLGSCGHRRKGDAKVDGSASVGTSASLLLEKTVLGVNANRLQSQYVTSKMTLSLRAGEKSMNVGGHLRMKRDDVIQLTLTALGIMELGRLEFTPDYMMVVDKMGKQYVKTTYDEIKALKSAGVDFYTFQSLFWDELFLPGSKGKQPKSSAFGIATEGERISLSHSPSSRATLTFLIGEVQEMVARTSITLSETGSKPLLEWDYAVYDKMGEQSFPTQMKISMPGTSAPIEATIRLRNLRADEGWQTRTELDTNRYKQVPLEKVMKSVTSMINKL